MIRLTGVEVSIGYHIENVFTSSISVTLGARNSFRSLKYKVLNLLWLLMKCCHAIVTSFLKKIKSKSKIAFRLLYNVYTGCSKKYPFLKATTRRIWMYFKSVFFAYCWKSSLSLIYSILLCFFSNYELITMIRMKRDRTKLVRLWHLQEKLRKKRNARLYIYISLRMAKNITVFCIGKILYAKSCSISPRTRSQFCVT